MQRGEIWWAALGAPSGSEPGKRRPVVILQSNSFNESGLNTVITVAITSNLRLAAAPGNLRCSRRTTGLSKTSVINVSQVATIDKSRLLKRVGALPARTLEDLEHGMRLVLGL